MIIIAVIVRFRWRAVRAATCRVADLVREAEAIAAKGQREIVLTGINVGDFGRTTGESFVDLLRALDAVGGIDPLPDFVDRT